MGTTGRRKNTTPTGTWCVIGVVGVIAVLGLIFGAVAWHAFRQMQNQGPSEWEAQDSNRFIVPQKNLIIGKQERTQGRSVNDYHVETMEEVGALYFLNEAGIIAESDGISSTLALDAFFNNTEILKGNGPPCGGAPTLKIDPQNDKCPRGFVGINVREPQCNLHVNETMCVEGETLFSGNVTIDGILFINNLVGVNFTVVQCNNDADCDDLNDCTIDQCTSNLCEYSLVNSCAHSNDCPGNAVCGENCSCMEFVKVECALNSDCNDSDSCTEDVCLSGICHNNPIPDCCTTNFDCLDFNECTIDNCVNGLCRNEQIPSCCTFDQTCDDFNDCTVDSCGEEGSCNFTLIGECAHSSDCPGNAVCVENCSCMEFIKPECEFHSDCNDLDSCTEDACISGICHHTVPEGTCNQDHFCKSNEVCNTTTCECVPECIQSECNTFPCGVSMCIGGECVFLHNDSSCCVSDFECATEDFDSCTTHKCVDNKCVQLFPFPPACAHDSNCGDNQICNASCVCVDIVPSLGECQNDADCDDNCTCTLDFCCNGKCNNLDSPGCCKADIQCFDNIECHTNHTCNLETGLCLHAIKDDDGDDVPCDIDCDDLDDGRGTAPTWYRDSDGDGDGNLAIKRVSCKEPLGFVETGTDCDDTDPFIFSGSVICNFTDFGNQFELASNPIDNDFSNAGYSVSIHNDKMIVGAPGILPFELRGAAIILSRYADNIWIEEAFLAPNISNTDRFGLEVKIYNDIAIVLCPFCGGLFGFTPVLIYEFDGSWSLVDGLSHPSGAATQFQIDLFEEKILFAASNTSAGFGRIRVYDRNQTTTFWEQTQIINVSEVVTDLAFDKSDSDYFAFGLDDRSVRVEFFTGGVYTFIAELTEDPDELKFGVSVDFHNGVLVVGSPTPNNTNFREKIFIYEVSGTNVSFVQFVRPRHVSMDGFSKCGESVAIYNDTIVVGCPNEKVNDHDTGAANIFKLINSQYRWISRMTAPSIENLVPTNLYGDSVDIDNGTIISGAPWADITETSHFSDGNVYINRCNEIRTC